jgi:polysaccharide pyruvyl transferase WcaK-like protein
MFGLFGIGNFGNEASLAAALEAAERVLPHARITTICSDPARVERQHGVPGVSINAAGRFDRLADGGRLRRLALRPVLEIARWRFALRYLRHVDLVVVPGTGILDDFRQRPTQLPLDVARWSVAARIAGARLVFLGIGAGPIVHPVSRFLMRLALAQADFCSYRDEGSRRFMASIGRQTGDDEVWPDLVFALDRDIAEPRIDARSFKVALGVMNYRGWHAVGVEADRIHARYAERMVALADQLRTAGYELCVVVGNDADLRVARAVTARLREPVDIVRSADLDDVRTAVMNTDVLVSSRYHNLVAALLGGVPAVSLSYADKNDQLLATFGLGEYCQHIEMVDIDLVLAHVEAIRADYAALVDELGRRVAAARTEVRARLDRQLDGSRT